MRLLVAVLAVIAALAAADQFFLWMERRGWIYWRRRKPDPRGAVLGPIDNVFNPAHEHVTQQQETEKRLADIQGDMQNIATPGAAVPRSSLRTAAPTVPAQRFRAASRAARTVALSSAAAASAGTERRSPVRRSRISTVPSLARSRPTTSV